MIPAQEFAKISSLLQLTGYQKAALAKGGFNDVSDLLLATSSDISRNCRLPPQEASRIVDLISRECARPLHLMSEILNQGQEKFTTGDAELDGVIGGGIRTGMIWEVVGESAAGKTQLALQLSLLVQLPPRLGGLAGSACYLTIASKLSTTRMEQLLNSHPLLSPSLCNMSDVQTISTSTIDRLIYVLSQTLPALISARAQDTSTKPVKLVIIDALAELFHSLGRTTTKTLVERSRQVSEISTLLHTLASKHQIAILVLNEVIDVIDRGPSTDAGDMSYRDQSRWFGRGDSAPGEDRKEATLGLVWANQVNVRIFLARTGRRRYLVESDGRVKKPRGPDLNPAHTTVQFEDQPTLIRRLTVIFSTVSMPASCDYIVTTQGVSVVPDTTIPAFVKTAQRSHPILPATITAKLPKPPASIQQHSQQDQDKSQLSPLDVGCAEDGITVDEHAYTLQPEPEDDEWDAFWAQNDLPHDVYEQVGDNKTLLTASP
ncbi:P-loop containing nucleoside triphosphate hydrolase protein [Leucogyrophana mollusca]|uniref:P-loop containing nucleoside triphosphate hydrolase protein n=1 Tax=Leucogyrophana mollusca TaxID=85980 RepID=A0ACB8C1F0_9AGAM|nr:P-loop containing nucleoside triphosphate hydrolase protein [Leucogyrophana mollusca]